MIVLILFTYAMALDISNKCTCNDLVNVMECNKHDYCAWNDS